MSEIELLLAAGPDPEHAERLMVYGRFVGSWDIDATWHERDGSSTTATGEWHFGWILGGRGVQDVLHRTGAPASKYGTSLRCYDHATDSWHVVWMQPASGEYVHLIGRAAGDRIVQETAACYGDKRLRWSFTEITHDSFVWLGEVSEDGGATWFLEQEMRARRAAARPHDRPDGALHDAPPEARPGRPRYHHVGIPTSEPQPGETFLPDHGVWCTDHEDNAYGIQWMRYAPDCPLPELVKTVAHVAFEVDDLEAALRGREILIAPNSPSPGVVVAFIAQNGAPVELLQVTDGDDAAAPGR